MTLRINNVVVTQPSAIMEQIPQIQTDTFSIAGAMQRNRLGQKKQAVLTWQDITPTQYQTLIAAFTTGSGLGYYNDQSNYAGGILTFSGMPTFEEGDYVVGSSLLRTLKATIREI